MVQSYGDLLFQIGMADTLEHMYISQQTSMIVEYIKNSQFAQAREVIFLLYIARTIFQPKGELSLVPSDLRQSMCLLI